MWQSLVGWCVFAHFQFCDTRDPQRASLHSIKASTMPSFKNPSKRKKSHVTRHMREMKKREPQLVEVVKNTLVIRGQKTSEPLMELLRDLVNKRATAKSTVSCPQHPPCNTNVYVYVFVYVCNDSTLFKSQQQNCFRARTHCGHLRTPARSSSCVKGMTVASLHLAHTRRSDPTISSWYGVFTHTMPSVYCLGAPLCPCLLAAASLLTQRSCTPHAPSPGSHV